MHEPSPSTSTTVPIYTNDACFGRESVAANTKVVMRIPTVEKIAVRTVNDSYESLLRFKLLTSLTMARNSTISRYKSDLKASTSNNSHKTTILEIRLLVFITSRSTTPSECTIRKQYS